jgi:hypothetical protein
MLSTLTADQREIRDAFRLHRGEGAGPAEIVLIWLRAFYRTSTCKTHNSTAVSTGVPNRLHGWRMAPGTELSCAMRVGDALMTSEATSMIDFVRVRLTSGASGGRAMTPEFAGNRD